MANKWSPDRLDMLGRLAGEKRSASQIAAAMSAKFGVAITRNAVIGQATRNAIRLDGPIFRGGRPRDKTSGGSSKISAPASRTKTCRSIEKMQAVQEPQGPVLPVVAFNSSTVEVIEQSNAAKAVLSLRPGQCRWPIGDTRGGAFHFCCEPVAGVGPYCAAHAQASIGKGTPSERSAVRVAERIAR